MRSSVFAGVFACVVAIATAGCSRRALDDAPDAGFIGGADAAGSDVAGWDVVGAIDAGPIDATDGGLVVPDAGTITLPSPPFAHCNRFGWGPIRSIAYSPDGTRIGVHAGRLVQVYDTRSGDRVAWYPAVDQYGTGPRFAFTADGAGVVAAQEDGSTRLLRGSFERIFPGSGLVALSPDGGTLAIVSDEDAETIRLWRAGDVVSLGRLTGHTGPILSLAFSRDGTRLVTGGEDQTARIWNLSDGSSVVIAAFDRWVVDVAMIDAERFATIAQGRGIGFWRLADGTPAPVTPAAWSNIVYGSFASDGALALVGQGSGGGGSNDAVQLRRATDGQVLWSTRTIEYDPLPNGINDQMYGVALAPGGNAAAANMGPGGVRIFNTADGSVARRIDGTYALRRPLIWPDGSRIAIDDTIYRLVNGTPLLRLGGPLWAISPDGMLAAATTGLIRSLTFSVVKASDGTAALALPGEGQPGVFSPDGTLLAAGRRIISTSDGTPVALLAGAAEYTTAAAAFSADGAIIAGTVPAAAGRQSTVVLWRASDGSELRRLGDVTPTAAFDSTAAWVEVRFSPDGALVAAAGSDAKVWSVADGAPVAVIPAPSGQNGVHSGGIDPRWRWLALPDPVRSVVRLYTLPQGQLVTGREFPGAPGPWTLGASFALDGTLVVASQASNTGWTVDVWCPAP